MKLGIGSYTFAWAVGIPGRLPERRMSPMNMLAEAQRYGVKLVQICDNMPFAELPAEEIESFAQAAEAAGIEIEIGTRGLDAEHLRHHLRLVQHFGGRFLRLVMDKGHDEPSADEAVARMRVVMPEFAEAGVRIAIENHDRFTAEALRGIVERLGPAHAGITLDTVNSFGATEGPQIVVPILAPYTMCLHVKDFTIRRPSHQLGFVVEGCAAGAGRLNVPWLLDQLRVSPHPFNCILETWVTPSDSLDETIARERAWADEGIAYLRGLIPD